MKTFPFHLLHEKAFEWFHGKYFPFNELKERASVLEATFLLAIIVILLYIWINLFLYWDEK